MLWTATDLRVAVRPASAGKESCEAHRPADGVQCPLPPRDRRGPGPSFGRTGTFPAWVNVVGLLLCALGYWFSAWALVENRFFTSTVRIQTERGHQVCGSGPYRAVRHPGYAGALLSVTPLALDTLWTFVAVGFALVVSVVRTVLEDRTLMEELPGYREYARRVRCRLFPGVW